MPKLHQVVAVKSGAKTRTQAAITDVHKLCQKEPLFSGLHRTYSPIKDAADGGIALPEERTHLQMTGLKAITAAMENWLEAIDLESTINAANAEAKADVEVNGKVLIKDAPVTFLMELEHKLDDMHKFVEVLPRLSPDIEWTWDENQQCYRNKHEIKTTKGEKIAYPFVRFKGDQHHPPQVDKEFKDEVVGYWTALKYSGAVSVQDHKAMLERVVELQKAVKMAKEKANQVEAPDRPVAAGLLDYVFGDIVKKGKK
jgi:hypothetical protein